ncbi:MAG: gamma-glutamylcyclotransferase family protein [Thermovenabulum sp.]|uniref:gamma-glutamylcyclotransferase family protein n=1 Tax=Thermovenabulum sp. TaxID=3100335 RepID=UPI003C7DF3BB
MPRIYLAYGSNMNIKQMARRCPTAKLIGPAILENYRLEFRGMNGNAVATITPEQGSIVPAVLWDLTPEDERALDRYEGYPFLYHKQDVVAKYKDGYIKAFVYKMNPGREWGTPSREYYNTIKQGYKTAGHDIEILNAALEYAKKFTREKTKKHIPVLLDF